MNDDNADITCHIFIFSAKIRKVDELSLIFLVKLSFFAKIKVLNRLYIYFVVKDRKLLWPKNI